MSKFSFIGLMGMVFVASAMAPACSDDEGKGGGSKDAGSDASSGGSSGSGGSGTGGSGGGSGGSGGGSGGVQEGGAPDAQPDGGSLCEVIGHTCHAVDDGDGPLHECHELGHAADEAVCAAEFEDCRDACGTALCDLIGERCHGFDDGDAAGLGHRCHELGHDGDPVACFEAAEECLAFCVVPDGGHGHDTGDGGHAEDGGHDGGPDASDAATD